MIQPWVWQIAALGSGGALIYGLVTGKMVGGVVTVKREESDYAFWLMAFVNAVLTGACLYFGLGF